MAGDWIKMRTDLREDPAVISTAHGLEISEDLVVGLLHRLWSWADRHTVDGNAVGVTYEWLDAYVGVTGFSARLEEVGWLERDGAILSLPNFERHNGQSAKRRALTAIRVRNARSVTREEKRREEKKRKKKEPPTVPLDKIEYPHGTDTPEVRAAIIQWCEYKQGRGERYKDIPHQIGLLLKKFGSAAAFIAAVENSMAQNYAGCFPPKEGTHGPSKSGFDLGPGHRHPDEPSGF